MKYDVCALGELLIDFTENGVSSQGNPLFEANPGGAPCNVLSMLAKMGHSTAFIGKVGADMFGDQLENAIKEVGISSEGLIRDNDVHTTLAFVHTFPDGDRDFSFYRKPGADMMLSEDDIKTSNVENIIRSAKIFHFGSLSLTDPVTEMATKKALDIAAEAGAIISFDPNLREPLWSSLDKARDMISYGMTKADVLKISDNEITWFTGEESYDKGAERLYKDYPQLRLLLVSLGREGSRAYVIRDGKPVSIEVKPFIQEATVETTGAGDTFYGGVLHYILTNGLKDYKDDELRDMLTFANAGASIITTRKGALRVMPSREEIEELIRSK